MTEVGVSGANSRRIIVRRSAGLVLVALLLVTAVIFYRATRAFPTGSDVAATPSHAPGATTNSAAAISGASNSPLSTSTPPTTWVPATSAPMAPSSTSTSTTTTTSAVSAFTDSATAGPDVTGATRATISHGVDDRPSDGPGVTEPGISLTARLAPDGNFDVAEWVLLPAPISTLSLRPPPIDQAGKEFAGHSPVATTIQLTAGDQPVMLLSDTLRAAVLLPLDSKEKQFELRYQLTGVTIHSSPSTAGRALAAIGSLTGPVAAGLPVQIAVIGSRIRNLACPALALDERSCAVGELPELRVNRALPWRDSIVVVQLDLSGPG
ncbi:MAG: hypothetical protein ACR2P2_13690 [Nakamurella sp.]